MRVSQAVEDDFFHGCRLAWMLAKRDLKSRYASSYAGIAWNIGVPLLNALVTSVVFSILMSGRMSSRYADVPFPIFFFVPFILWAGFVEIVGRSPHILKDHSYLINKIAFPAWVLPLVPLGSALITQLVMLVVLIGLFTFNGTAPAASSIYFLFIWAMCLMFTIGVGYAVSAISVYLPDMAQIVPLLINITFWLTPITYPATLVTDSGFALARHIIMDFNPFYYFAETARLAVLGGASVSATTIVGLAFVASGTLWVGYRIYNRLQPGFADVV